MTKPSRTIYVVVGTYSEPGEYSEWMVRAFPTAAKAVRFVARATESLLEIRQAVDHYKVQHPSPYWNSGWTYDAAAIVAWNVDWDNFVNRLIADSLDLGLGDYKYGLDSVGYECGSVEFDDEA